MRKLSATVLAGVAGLALAGTAFAATPRTHVLNFPLPNGSVARVEYAGDVAPKVTIAPRPMADLGQWTAMGLPSFAGFDRMIAEMDRQSEQMQHQIQQMAQHAPGTAGARPYIASYGNLPSGSTSTTVISVTSGGATCTRTTESVAEGPGKPPRVTSSVTGECGVGAAPGQSAASINHT